MTIIKWRMSGQGSAYDQLFEPEASILSKRLTLSAASIFVTEGLFIYIYFLLFEEIHQNRIFKAGEKIFQRFRSFFVKRLLKY